jgi:hypothetical protein
MGTTRGRRRGRRRRGRRREGGGEEGGERKGERYQNICVLTCFAQHAQYAHRVTKHTVQQHGGAGVYFICRLLYCDARL